MHPLICLALLPALLLATFPACAETNSPPLSLPGRVQKACAEKKIDDRLSALANVAKTLSLSEFPAQFEPPMI